MILCCELPWGKSRAVITVNITPLPCFLGRTCVLLKLSETSVDYMVTYFCVKSNFWLFRTLKTIAHGRLRRVWITSFLVWRSEADAVGWMSEWVCYWLCVTVTSPQAQGSTSFCQRSADTEERCQLLTWRSVFLLDFENKTAGCRKTGQCKGQLLVHKISSSHDCSFPGSKEYIERIEIQIWKRHNVALWMIVGELCLDETSK